MRSQAPYLKVSGLPSELSKLGLVTKVKKLFGNKIHSRIWVHEVSDVNSGREAIIELQHKYEANKAKQLLTTKSFPYKEKVYDVTAVFTDYDGISQFNDSRAEEHRRLSPKHQVGETSKFDLEIELMRKQRELIEEERMLLQKKRELELLQEQEYAGGVRGEPYSETRITDIDNPSQTGVYEDNIPGFENPMGPRFNDAPYPKSRDQAMPFDLSPINVGIGQAIATNLQETQFPEFFGPMNAIIDQISEVMTVPLSDAEKAYFTVNFGVIIRQRIAEAVKGKPVMPSNSIVNLYWKSHPIMDDGMIITKIRNDFEQQQVAKQRNDGFHVNVNNDERMFQGDFSGPSTSGMSKTRPQPDLITDCGDYNPYYGKPPSAIPSYGVDDHNSLIHDRNYSGRDRHNDNDSSNNLMSSSGEGSRRKRTNRWDTDDIPTNKGRNFYEGKDDNFIHEGDSMRRGGDGLNREVNTSLDRRGGMDMAYRNPGRYSYQNDRTYDPDNDNRHWGEKNLKRQSSESRRDDFMDKGGADQSYNKRSRWNDVNEDEGAGRAFNTPNNPGIRSDERSASFNRYDSNLLRDNVRNDFDRGTNSSFEGGHDMNRRGNYSRDDDNVNIGTQAWEGRRQEVPNDFNRVNFNMHSNRRVNDMNTVENDTTRHFVRNEFNSGEDFIPLRSETGRNRNSINRDDDEIRRGIARSGNNDHNINSDRRDMPRERFDSVHGGKMQRNDGFDRRGNMERETNNPNESNYNTARGGHFMNREFNARGSTGGRGEDYNRQPGNTLENRERNVNLERFDNSVERRGYNRDQGGYMDKGENFNRADPDINRGGSNMARGGYNMSAGGSSMGRDGGSMGRGGNTMGRGGSSMGRGGSSMSRGGSSVGRGGSIMDKGERSTARGGSSMSRGRSSLSRGGGSMGRDGSSMARGGSSMSRWGSSVGRGGSSMGRGGGSMGRDGSSMARGGSSMSRGGSNLAREGGSMGRGGNNIARGGNSRGRGEIDRGRGGNDRGRGGIDRGRGGNINRGVGYQ